MRFILISFGPPAASARIARDRTKGFSSNTALHYKSHHLWWLGKVNEMPIKEAREHVSELLETLSHIICFLVENV
jgi:hypothetical protein